MEKRTSIIRSVITSSNPNWMKFLKDSFSEDVVDTDSFIINCQLDEEANSHTFFQRLFRMRELYLEHNKPHIICKNIVYDVKDLNRCMNWIDRKILNEDRNGLLLVTPYTLLNVDTQCYWSHEDLVGKIRGLH